MISAGSTLQNLGWNDAWGSLHAQSTSSGTPGRVIRSGRILLVQTERDCVLATCPNDDRQRPVCGDWVLLEVHSGARGEESRGIVRETLTRRNAIVRKAAGANRQQAIVANIDAVWLVCGLDRDQGIRSLSRYQALTRLDGVTVTVVLNKADIAADLERQLSEAQGKAPDLEVIALSAHARLGLDRVTPQLSNGRTIALVGPSGVGKSTLMNALTTSPSQATGSVRSGDHRGCHTTSASQLVATSYGALLIDTPGLRELGLWQAAGLKNAYADILALAEGCRFSDCRHDREPGCQIRLALERGELVPDRFHAYLELLRECME